MSTRRAVIILVLTFLALWWGMEKGLDKSEQHNEQVSTCCDS